MSFISTTLLSVIAILLASTAYTLFAPALMQKSDKIPVPAPTSSKKYMSMLSSYQSVNNVICPLLPTSFMDMIIQVIPKTILFLTASLASIAFLYANVRGRSSNISL